MTNIDWSTVFEEIIKRRPGAWNEEVAEFEATVQQPLTDFEYAYLARSLEWDRARRWKMPEGELPRSYLELLRWSNGGEFRNGDRLMQFFSALDAGQGVRTMMLAYGVPELFPGLLPFAFNGGGIFYAFEMHLHPADDEYTIVAAECGYSHNPFKLADTLMDACRDRRAIEDLWDEEDEILQPVCEWCGEYLVCPECGRHGRIIHQ